MDMNFCRRCGTVLKNVENHVYACKNNHVVYANAAPASCLWVVNDKNEVLVAVRSLDPGMGLLDAPGGFCDGAETFEAGIARELEEEVGLKPTDYTAPVYLLSALDDYSYKGEVITVLANTYYAKLIGNPTITPQDDVAQARFVPIEEINPTDIYFNAVRESFLHLRTLMESWQ